MPERLQKLLAQAGHGSRRACEALIREGRVRVNGRVAHLGDRADLAVDRVTLDGRPLAVEPPIYVILNKPRQVISSLEDELSADRTTVRDLIPLPGHLYPVGRLDKQSEGLILMTNDGELAHRLTHPRFGHEKRYRVLIDGQLSEEARQQWERGVMLDGHKTAPARIKVVSQQKDHSWLMITLREGRKRQIRRVAASFGYSVRRLVRERLGPLQLGDLPSGQWRHLSADEVRQLRRVAGLK